VPLPNSSTIKCKYRNNVPTSTSDNVYGWSKEPGRLRPAVANAARPDDLRRFSATHLSRTALTHAKHRRLPQISIFDLLPNKPKLTWAFSIRQIFLATLGVSAPLRSARG
jgi:hypothetical protein